MKNWEVFVITNVLSFIGYKIIFPSEPAKKMEERCETNSACLMKAVQLFESSIDNSFPPCEDFYQFACHGWIKSRVAKLKETKAKSASRTSDLIKRNELSIRALLGKVETRKFKFKTPKKLNINNLPTESIPTWSSGSERKLKQFYTSCTTNTRGEDVINYEDGHGRDFSGTFTNWLSDATIVSPEPAVIDLYSGLSLDSNDFLENLKQVDKFNKILESIPSLDGAITSAQSTLLANATYSLVHDFVVLSPGEVSQREICKWNYLPMLKFGGDICIKSGKNSQQIWKMKNLPGFGEWCQAFRDDAVETILFRDQAQTDEHSPASIRVLGTLSNFKEFSDAFLCPRETRYNPSEKCRFF
ncbi:Neprilysin [Folsomia candida]|uniref:Neprilysin n=1 Tax=Folsomia candida TaxID=158441 RepID=A0A226DMM7_FOLCA|nr:Neprilysin [Folsomia candida]